MRALFIVLTAFTVIGAVACSATPSPVLTHTASISSPDDRMSGPIADVWRSRCGNCHTPVEPGTHTRAALEDAFTRHKSRAHLTDDQWVAMTDFLAKD